MEKHELTQIAADQLEAAKASPDGLSSQLLVGDDEGSIQQTVVALTEGNIVGARESTEHTTIQVLSGEVRVRSTEGSESATEGELVEIPTDPHVISAKQDSTVLLTESKSDSGGWDPQTRR